MTDSSVVVDNLTKEEARSLNAVYNNKSKFKKRRQHKPKNYDNSVDQIETKVSSQLQHSQQQPQQHSQQPPLPVQETVTNTQEIKSQPSTVTESQNMESQDVEVDFTIPTDLKTWLSNKENYKLKQQKKKEDSKKYWTDRTKTLDEEAIKLKNEVFERLRQMNKSDLNNIYYKWHSYLNEISRDIAHYNKSNLDDMKVAMYSLEKLNLYSIIVNEFFYILNSFYTCSPQAVVATVTEQPITSVDYPMELTISNFKSALRYHIEKEKMTNLIEIYTTLYGSSSFDETYIEINPSNETLLQDYVKFKLNERMKYLESKRVATYKANQLVGIRDKANDIYLGQIISVIPYENHTIYYVRYIGFDDAFNEFINDTRRILPYNQHKKYRVQG